MEICEDEESNDCRVVIVNSWINGNITDVKRTMKHRSKCFAISLIPVLVGQYGYQYHNAIWEVKKMCDCEDTR